MLIGVIPLTGNVVIKGLEIEHDNNKKGGFIEDPSCPGQITFLDQITIRNTATGIAVGGFDIVNEVYGVPRLSPDGLTIAGRWADDSVCFDDDPALTVWDRNGREIVRALPDIGDFDWLPDGRLVFEIDGDVAVETERNTFRFERIARLGNIPGTPHEFDVSPDGGSIVFEMVTDVSGFLVTVDFRAATVWRINVDGTGLERIVESSRETDIEDMNVNGPVFSPDGSLLMVTENWLSGGVATSTGFDGPDFPIITGVDFTPVTNGAVAQVFPLTELPTALPPVSWSSDGIRPVFERDSDASLDLARLWPLEGRRCANAVTPPPTQAGSLLGQNGQVNRGLSGSLYRYSNEDESRIEKMDLATGVVATVVELPGVSSVESESFSISDDESRIAIVIRETFDYSMRVYDDAGALLRDYELETNSYHLLPESTPRFAPDSNSLIAWAYDDDDFGQALVVFDINEGGFFERTDLGFVDVVEWFPNGDLLLVDGTSMYRQSTNTDGNGLAEPELIVNVQERIRDVAVHPDGRQIVYVSGQQLLSINVEDGTQRRIAAWTENEVANPDFSPDGRYIVFKKLSSFEFGWPWIVASDAQNVRIREHTALSATGAMRAGEGTSVDWRVTRHEVLWR